ncbi:hypothetical protein R6Q59_017834 [Mikania micrantha]
MEPDQLPADDLTPPCTITDRQLQQSKTHTLIRSYDCKFCKRGFTNAQALGGHMNIHRKDKTKFKYASSSIAMPPNPLAEPPSPTRSQPSHAATSNFFSFSHQVNWFSVTPQDELAPRSIYEPGNPPLPVGDVDLELRLGHVEPQQEYSSSENKTTTARKFF